MSTCLSTAGFVKIKLILIFKYFKKLHKLCKSSTISGKSTSLLMTGSSSKRRRSSRKSTSAGERNKEKRKRKGKKMIHPMSHKLKMVKLKLARKMLK